MAYTDKTKMIAHFGEVELTQLTDRDMVGSVNDAVLTRAITAVCSWIDTQVGDRYETPISTPSETVVDLCEDLVRCKLFTQDDTDRTNDLCRMARQFFMDVRNGKQTLPGGVLKVSGGAQAIGTRQDPIFSNTVMDKMPGVES